MAELSDNDLHSRLKLIRCNLPITTLHQLLDQFSSARAIFDASTSQLNKIQLNDAQISRIQNSDNKEIERDLAWLDHADHGILFQDAINFPQQLLEISDPPYALFYIGDIDYLQQPQLAMVGSRTPSASGKQIA